MRPAAIHICKLSLRLPAAACVDRSVVHPRVERARGPRAALGALPVRSPGRPEGSTAIHAQAAARSRDCRCRCRSWSQSRLLPATIRVGRAPQSQVSGANVCNASASAGPWLLKRWWGRRRVQICLQWRRYVYATRPTRLAQPRSVRFFALSAQQRAISTSQPPSPPY